MKELKFYNSDLNHLHPIATSSRKLTTNDHVTALSPQTTSFFDSQQPQVLPLVFFFKLFMQQLKQSLSS